MAPEGAQEELALTLHGIHPLGDQKGPLIVALALLGRALAGAGVPSYRSMWVKSRPHSLQGSLENSRTAPRR